MTAIWPRSRLQQAAPNKSRRAEVFRNRWVSGCIWSRPKAESVARRIWPGFLSLMRAEAHVCFVLAQYTEAMGIPPIFQFAKSGHSRLRSTCCWTSLFVLHAAVMACALVKRPIWCAHRSVFFSIWPRSKGEISPPLGAVPTQNLD